MEARQQQIRLRAILDRRPFVVAFERDCAAQLEEENCEGFAFAPICSPHSQSNAIWGRINNVTVKIQHFSDVQYKEANFRWVYGSLKYQICAQPLSLSEIL